MKNLDDLLEHQLKDLYSAESQIIKALPKMAKKASDEQLKQALTDHLAETEEQKKRLEEACKILGFKPSGETCKAIEGILKEASDFLSESAEPAVMDAGIIAEAQRVEHYEISGYGTAARYAKQLGHKEVAKLLDQTLAEEQNADTKLNNLAIERINVEAE
ncbi:ferritin-like domain-containing protein [Arundinibacter roseus]|uniref:Ferritin-like domain-containing protein n=2 Tax=Arundinibacter roseus TaxID=2070510 RepID=A0A4V2XAN2_9BACT|nr:ferritin-like domain-containing protein [Arundinibacter roseus]